MITFIVNPAAGNGISLKAESMITEQMVKHPEYAYCIKRTEHPGHATTLAAEAVHSGAEAVIAVGGDGTCFEVSCGLMGSTTPLGIIPAGTGMRRYANVQLESNAPEAVAESESEAPAEVIETPSVDEETPAFAEE